MMNHDALEQDMASYLKRTLAGGFHTREEAQQTVIDVYDGEADLETRRTLAEKLTAKLYLEQLEAQSDWPASTDCDQLDQALDELNRGGIVSRQNFSCCGTCGAVEIGDEMQVEEENGIRVRGYTFYHMQDTESAAAGYGLYLNYGSVDPGEAPALAIGHEIIDAMQRNGLKTEWNGSLNKRIVVKLDWKRRMPGT